MRRPLLRSLLLLLLALSPRIHAASAATTHKVVRMSSLTIRKATCMRATVAESAILRLSVLATECTPKASCGLVHFPQRRGALLSALKAEVSAAQIKRDSKILLSHGGFYEGVPCL